MADNAQSGRPARGASVLNLGLSALAAGALGFLVFAMPESVFSDLIVQSALRRHESRGLHFTLDYPETAPEAVDTILIP